MQDENMKICVNRIVAEALFEKCGYKNKKEILSEDGINPEYIEIIIDSHLTEAGIEKVKNYVLSESNNSNEAEKELKDFLSFLPDEKVLRSNPVVVFWNED